MAYGIIVDGTKKGCIGDIGIYHYCDEGVEYEGQRFEFHRCGISYDDNDGYLKIITPDTTPDMDSLYNKMKLECHMSVDEGCPSYKIEIVRLTKEEYDKIRYDRSTRSKHSWADYYYKHKKYSKRLNEKAKWKIGDRVEISFVDPRAKSHLVGDDYEPLSFTKGCKGTVIRHSDGHHDGIDYLIEFDERIGNLSLEYGKNDHCFWMNKSKENGRLEKRLFMWDKPVLLECKSIKTDQIQMKNTQIFDEIVEALYKMKSQEMAISNLLETIEIL